MQFRIVYKLQIIIEKSMFPIPAWMEYVQATKSVDNLA